MRLVHFSRKPLNLLAKGVEYGVHRDRPYFKPHGLWVSDEDEHGWKSWCQSEQWGEETLTHACDVSLKDDANILYIRTASELNEFTEQYKRVDSLDAELDITRIDWPRVMPEYDGIIITPYQWSMRLDLMWYYGWDCASGCIWNIGAIDKVTPITGDDYVRLMETEKEDA